MFQSIIVKLRKRYKAGFICCFSLCSGQLLHAQLEEAVEAPLYRWVTASNAGGTSGNWFGQGSESFDGVDALQSGSIAAGKRSWLDTEINGPARVTFQWKVSSDRRIPGQGILQLLVGKPVNGGVEWSFQNSILGEVDWQEETVIIPKGSHRVRWEYYKTAQASATGKDAGFVDAVRIEPSQEVSLRSALDSNTLPWSSGGTAGKGRIEWFGQGMETSDGSDAARSPIIGSGENSWLETQVIGPGTISYDWALSGDGRVPGQASLTLEISEGSDSWQSLASITGEVGWQKKSSTIPAGIKRLRWRYTKGAQTSDEGKDAAWLDKVSFTPDSFQSSPRIALADNRYEIILPPGGSEILPISISNLGVQPLDITEAALDKQWASAVNPTKTIGGLSTHKLIIEISAAGLDAGDYDAVLTLDSTAVNQPKLEIPIHLTVGAGGMLDSDRDGITDIYESTHQLESGRDDSDRDKDADGVSNYLEFLLGSSASDPESTPDLPFTVSDAVQLIFPTTKGVVYQLQSTSDLESGIWSNLGDPITGTGKTTSHFVPVKNKQNFFYRITVK